MGELPLDIQLRLLPVLERRQVKRVRGNGDRSVDVRSVASAHAERAWLLTPQ